MMGADKLLLSVIAQYRTDLASAHAEICRLSGLDPATHSWPDWSPQANTLRWLDKIIASAGEAGTAETNADSVQPEGRARDGEAGTPK